MPATYSRFSRGAPRLQLSLERKEREKLCFRAFPVAARGLDVVIDHSITLLRSPAQLRRARTVRSQHNPITVCRSHDGVEARRRLPRELGAVDDQAYLGIENPRSLVEIHRADIDLLAVEHEELRVQRIVAGALGRRRL